MTSFAATRRITRTDVERCRLDGGTHRVSFSYIHTDQPRRYDPPRVGAFSLPFRETIGRIFEADTGLRLFSSKNSQMGVYRMIPSEQEFAQIQHWVERQGTRIFLRDCLDLSIALDQNLVDNQSGQYTNLGYLESVAKVEPHEAAIDGIVRHCCSAISDLPHYRNARQLAAVPARPGKTYDLPTVLAQRIAKRLGLRDLTRHFTFIGSKDSIKSLELGQKWDAWERAGLTFDQELDNSAPVILIDDKYQSGITIQFVASRLQAAGAGEIYGLCAVKTLRDTDNA